MNNEAGTAMMIMIVLLWLMTTTRFQNFVKVVKQP